jgi:DNA replicative helicase MCM subunit Mcm2 (Cdc46/Mcm family)
LTSGNVERKFSEFLRALRRDYKLQCFHISFEDLFIDEDLIDLLKADIDKFYSLLEEGLYTKLCKYRDIKEKIFNANPEREYRLVSDELHIVVDFIEKTLGSRNLKDFSKDQSKNVGNIFAITGRMGDSMLTKSVKHRVLEFECLCGTKFFKRNNKYATKYMIPLSCTNCQNKFFDESNIISKKIFEIGLFKLFDEDLDNNKYDFDCKIFKNLDYFMNIVRSININETVKIIGILRTDDSNIKGRTKAESQKLHNYYIEVLDIETFKSYEIDEELILVLKDKLNTNPHYREILIDSSFPYTFMVDGFFPPKLVAGLSYVSAGSRKRIRDTINVIEGSGSGVYKSSVLENLENILLGKGIHVVETSKITGPGVIGTSNIDKKTNKVIITPGFLPRNSNNLIVLDETQEITFEILLKFKCVEKGYCGQIQHAENWRSPANSGLLFIQNFMSHHNQWYDPGVDIYKNLGWKDKRAKSLLERFDLFCVLKKPDLYTRKLINNNERAISDGTHYKNIGELLELEDYDFPNLIDNEEGQIEYLVKNYLYKAKEIYPDATNPEEIKDLIRDLYEFAIEYQSKNYEETDLDITVRTKNSMFKVLRALSSLRLDDISHEKDLEYFKNRCMKLILPFFNSGFVSDSKEVLTNKFFNDSIKELLQEKLLPLVSIKELINFMREKLKGRIPHIDFNDLSEENKPILNKTLKELDSILPLASSLDKNYPFRQLLLNNELKINEFGFYREVISKRIGTYIVYKEGEKDPLFNEDKSLVLKFLFKIVEIFNEKKKPIELSILSSELEKHFSPEIVDRILDNLIESEKYLEKIIVKE